MRYVPPKLWPWSLVGYALAGLLPAVLMAPAAALFIRSGIRPGFSTAILVNLFIPAIFVVTAFLFPRVRFVWIGVPLALFLYTFERTLELNPQWWTWTPGFFAARIHPIVTVSCVISGAIATAACYAIRPIRVVGVRPFPACPDCGHDTTGFETCNECGRDMRAYANPTGSPIIP